jgi:hypothetical protein
MQIALGDPAPDARQQSSVEHADVDAVEQLDRRGAVDAIRHGTILSNREAALDACPATPHRRRRPSRRRERRP